MIILIPIRAGSKRLKNKNILKVNKKRLFEYTFELIDKLKLKSKTFVSTDSQVVIKYCKKKNFNFIIRPKKISKSNSNIEETIKHFKQKIKFQNNTYIFLLQVTSPLRTIQTTKKFLSICVKLKKRFDTFISVIESKKDIWLEKKSRGIRLLKNEPRNQLLRKSIYEEDGLFYFFKYKNILTNKSILGNRVYLFKSKKKEALDINTKKDLEKFKYSLNEKIK
jgi:CMP-N,N'-diacetyllegionaminic acid synthase